MGVYLARYIGSGHPDDPWRPDVGDASEWHAVDLRPDGNQGDGWGLLRVPGPLLPSSPNRLILSDHLDEASTTVRQRLEDRLGRNLDGPSMRRWLLDLMLQGLGGRCRPLEPNHLGGGARRYELWLGELVDTLPVIAGGGLFDDFNRADSSNLGVDWFESTVDVQIVSNAVRQVATSTSRALVVHNTALASADHWAEVLAAIVVTGTSNKIIGPMVRVLDDAGGTDGYVWRQLWTNLAVTASLAWNRCDNASGTAGFTLLGSATTNIVATGDRYRGEANGSTLTGKQNGTIVGSAVTDTTYPSNTLVGFQIASPNGAANSTVDEFSADTLGGPAATGSTRARIAVRSISAAAKAIIAPVTRCALAIGSRAAGAKGTVGQAAARLAARTTAVTGTKTTSGTARSALSARVRSSATKAVAGSARSATSTRCGTAAGAKAVIGSTRAEPIASRCSTGGSKGSSGALWARCAARAATSGLKSAAGSGRLAAAPRCRSAGAKGATCSTRASTASRCRSTATKTTMGTARCHVAIRGSAAPLVIPLRNLLWLAGSPMPKWVAGEPQSKWHAGAAISKWVAGPPRR